MNSNAIRAAYIKFLYDECKAKGDYTHSEIQKEINDFLNTRDGKRGLKVFTQSKKVTKAMTEKQQEIADIIKRVSEIKRKESIYRCERCQSGESVELYCIDNNMENQGFLCKSCVNKMAK